MESGRAHRGSCDGAADRRLPRYRVERWRGYVTSTFYVRSHTGEVHESPPFRWRKPSTPPNDGPAREAFDELVARLLDLGWIRVGDGPEWYAAEFSHPAAEPVAGTQTVPEPEPQPTPPAAEPAPLPTPLSTPRPEPPDEPVSPPAARRPDTAVSPAAPPPGRRFGRRGVVAATGVVAAVAAAALFLGLEGGKSALAPAARPAAPTRPPAPAAPAKPPHRTQAVSPAARRPTSVSVRITAAGNGSWLELRRGSRSGTVLYSGVLEPGRTLQLFRPAAARPAG